MNRIIKNIVFVVFFICCIENVTAQQDNAEYYGGVELYYYEYYPEYEWSELKDLYYYSESLPQNIKIWAFFPLWQIYRNPTCSFSSGIDCPYFLSLLNPSMSNHETDSYGERLSFPDDNSTYTILEFWARSQSNDYSLVNSKQVNLQYPYSEKTETLRVNCNNSYSGCGNFTGYIDFFFKAFLKPYKIGLFYYGPDNKYVNSEVGLDFPSDDKIILKATKGFPSEVYKWKYRLGKIGYNWINFPDQFQGKDSIAFSWRELEAVYPGIISQKYYSSGGGSIDVMIDFDRYVNSQNDTITLNLKKSAPHIDTAIVKQPTCYGYDDGEVKLFLNRPLNNGETCQIKVRDEDGLDDEKTITLNSDSGSIIILSKLTNDTIIYVIADAKDHNGKQEYVKGINHEVEVKINKPTQFSWSFTPPTAVPEYYRSNFISCNGGSDGSLPVPQYSGGTPSYIYIFKHEGDLESTENRSPFTYNETLKNKSAGKYILQVKDTFGCGQSIDKRDYTIEQPFPIQISLDENNTKNLSGFETQDGKIQAHIKKPRLEDQERQYQYVWQDSLGNIIPSQEIDDVSDTNYVYSSISNLSSGKYKLYVSVKKWYNIRTIPDFSTPNGCGCIDTLDVIITQPDPIVINIDTLQQVKCTGGSDGELVAHVTGGVKPYTYAWYQDDVLQYSDSIITGAVGNYKMVLTDANGITKEAIAYLPQIDSLKIDSLHITDVYCAGNETGRIEAFVSGGTLGYKYFWSNGAETSVIENLKGGTYTLSVKDANACSASISAIVNASNKITYGLTTENLTCYHSNDGSIEINNIEGGNSPYLIKWEDDYTGLLRDNMSAGNYYIEIEDSRNCIEPINVTLSEPDSIILNIPKQSYVLCKGQDLELNIAIEDDAASYNWYKENILMAETPSITISEKGNYRAEVFDANACRGDAAFTVNRTDNEIFADFLVAGVVAKNDEVHVINITNPSAEKMEWILPPASDIQVNRNDSLFLDVIFARCDSFDILLKTSQWGCEKITTKKIIVVEQSEMSDYKEGDTAFIEKFFVAPNPNDGNFDAVVELGEQMDIALILYDVSKAKTIETRYLKGSEYYKESFQLSLVSGTYLLRLITPNPQIYSTLKITIK